MIKQYYLGCLAHASYLIADEESKIAAVVDPQRDIDHYLSEARDMGVTIRHVLLTHFHADFLAGHLELREATGAAISLGAKAQAEYEFTPLADGAEVKLGPNVRLGVLETPGHTPEGISILVYEGPGPDPKAVLTGDTLFIGSVGRPDLMASVGVSAEELAGMLHDSLHRLLELPDPTLVYPAHGAGSFCGKGLSKETVSTIGAQRTTNLALRPMTREEFVAEASSNLPPTPGYFSHDAQLNRQERPTLDAARATGLRALPLEAVLRLQNAGAAVVDVREPTEYAERHLAGSLNVGLSGQFASWAGTLIEPGRPLVIVAPEGREEEAVTRLGRIGFDSVQGHLEGGIASVRERDEATATVRRFSAPELGQALAENEAPHVLDVRALHERQESHIPGSLHIPLPELPKRVNEIPRDRPVVVHCRTGFRSMIAASILEAHGFVGVGDLEGGIVAWDQTVGAS